MLQSFVLMYCRIYAGKRQAGCHLLIFRGHVLLLLRRHLLAIFVRFKNYDYKEIEANHSCH